MSTSSSRPGAAHPESPVSIAYIALGSNLGDRAGQLRAAAEGIAALDDVEILARSRMMESPAQETDEPQPAYLNAVLAIATRQGPHDLWRALAALEARLGRTRPVGRRNAPRTIDIDLLAYDELSLTTPTLTLPHPRMFTRPFVILPLLDIGVERIHGILLSNLPCAQSDRVTPIETRWSAC